MATQNVLQKLYLDVVDSRGQLTTMTLSASSSSFGDTTSIKSIFQAGGHAVNITRIFPHPSLPIVATLDATNHLLIWQRNISDLKQTEIAHYKEQFQFTWLCSDQRSLGLFVFQLQDSFRLIVVEYALDNQIEPIELCRFDIDLFCSNLSEMDVFSSGPFLFLQSSAATLIGHMANLTSSESVKRLHPIPLRSLQYRPIHPSGFLYSAKDPVTGSIQIAKLNSGDSSDVTFQPIGKPFLPQYHHTLVIQPGVVFNWEKDGQTFRGQLLTSITTGFAEWCTLDEIEFTIPLSIAKEDVIVRSTEHFNLNNLVMVIIGRAIFSFTIFNDEKLVLKRTVSLGVVPIETSSKTGSMQLQCLYTTPNRKRLQKF